MILAVEQTQPGGVTQGDDAMIINWSGKGNYIQAGGVVRRAAGCELISWYCTSIREIKSTFGINHCQVMDWTVL